MWTETLAGINEEIVIMTLPITSLSARWSKLRYPWLFLLYDSGIWWQQMQLISPLGRIYASVNRVSIGSGNVLSPFGSKPLPKPNGGLLSIRLMGTNFNESRIGILSFSFKKMHLKLSSAKWRPLGPVGDELKGAIHCNNMLQKESNIHKQRGS